MGIYVKTEKGTDSLDYLNRIKSLEDSVTKLQNKVMTLQKYEITFVSSNADSSKSYLNCYQFGNVVMVEGTVFIKIFIPAYGGMCVAKGFPSPIPISLLYTFNQLLQMVNMRLLCHL